MDLPIVTRCCCCSLRSGGIIIGWLSTVVGVLMFSLLVSATYIEITEMPSELNTTEFVVLVIITVLQLFYIFAGILLLYGIREGNYWKILPLTVVSVIGSIITLLNASFSYSNTSILICELGLALVQIGFALVGYSLYVDTKNKETHRRTSPNSTTQHCANFPEV